MSQCCRESGGLQLAESEGATLFIYKLVYIYIYIYIYVCVFIKYNRELIQSITNILYYDKFHMATCFDLQ
jgi:hypothetical protein